MGILRHNLSTDQLSKWKQQVVENVVTLFVSSTDQQSNKAAERIAHLEQLVGRLTPSEEWQIAEALSSHYSVRQICEVLGFTRSNFYYHPKEDPYEHLLRDEI